MKNTLTSVLHMCSLFHAFMFAQLWTIYCEQAAAAPSLQNQNQTEFSSTAILTGLEFWSRVTPSILQLMAHNKVMVEMVCLHVISLMEALQECNSAIFVKLIPMWLPMIQSNLKHLSAGLRLRLQAIQNRVNHLQGQAAGTPPAALRKWLQCTQFKMAQIEIQSSEAASQFYPMLSVKLPLAITAHIDHRPIPVEPDIGGKQDYFGRTLPPSSLPHPSLKVAKPAAPSRSPLATKATHSCLTPALIQDVVDPSPASPSLLIKAGPSPRCVLLSCRSPLSLAAAYVIRVPQVPRPGPAPLGFGGASARADLMRRQLEGSQARRERESGSSNMVKVSFEMDCGYTRMSRGL
ncbi:hypothetical protein WMY93_017354 [Mugilogobius chulae]|uniref:Uncharacterized protein n=1 Tax=Mugilogobius chulae TaxID=88201 RepID=A0AAW0NSX5_9GOBI